MIDNFNKVSDSFMCPYCMSESKLEKIQFRSTNTKIKNTPDNKKIQFWYDLLNRNPLFISPPAFTPRIRNLGLQSIHNKSGYSVPVAYVDEGGCCTDIRLCPICHNDLPENIGFVNTANIIIIGDDSLNSLNFVKNMFNSLLDKCAVENTDFYVSNQKEWQDINKYGANNISYLVGKTVFFSSKRKTLLEVTITYYPLGLDEISNISNRQMSKFLLNSNGIIIVSDYENLFGEENENGSCLEQYLFKIKDILGMCAHDNSAHPVSVVFTGIEKLNNISNINTKNIDILYDCDSELSNNITENILLNGNNRALQNIKAIYSNSFLFSVPNNSEYCKNNNFIYQNPIEWIFQRNSYINNRRKTEKRS